MRKELIINTKGMKVDSFFENDSDTVIISSTLTRWIRKLKYKIKFNHLSSLDQINFELNKIVDFNNWQPLQDNKIHRIENFAWNSLGFQRLYQLVNQPELSSLKTFQEVTLLGLNQSETRDNTSLTSIWIGERQGYQFALMHLGRYYSAGISNMSGSSPTTMVFPIDILKNLTGIRS
jgi:hypothetical protein